MLNFKNINIKVIPKADDVKWELYSGWGQISICPSYRILFSSVAWVTWGIAIILHNSFISNYQTTVLKLRPQVGLEATLFTNLTHKITLSLVLFFSDTLAGFRDQTTKHRFTLCKSYNKIQCLNRMYNPDKSVIYRIINSIFLITCGQLWW